MVHLYTHMEILETSHILFHMILFVLSRIINSFSITQIRKIHLMEYSKVQKKIEAQGYKNHELDCKSY